MEATLSDHWKLELNESQQGLEVVSKVTVRVKVEIAYKYEKRKRVDEGRARS
jgi:hypothetical protein